MPGQMSDLSRLSDLQDVDLEIQSLSGDLAEVGRQLADEGEMPKLMNRLERIEAALADRSSKARSGEREVERLALEAGELERRLYDGSVTNQREFEALGEQRDFAAAERGRAEEGLLEVMVEIEDLEGSAGRHRDAIARLTRSRERQVADLTTREAELTERIAGLKAERERRCVGIPPVLMARYDSLRRLRGGRALAPLEGSMCGACRVEQPRGNLSRARAGVHLVECNSCRRILLAG